jgi:long-subunit fatty acid transport protein
VDLERKTGSAVAIKRNFFILIFFAFQNIVFAQGLQPQPPLELLNAGWGAPATGLGGAYVGIAEDLTAIYWNPAGLAQLPGLQVFGEYYISGDQDEDYAAEVFADRFESAQRFSGSGNQFDFVGVSYAFTSGSTRIVPAFAWHRNSGNPLERDLKELAGVVDFLTPSTFIQSQGAFNQEFKHPGEEYSVAVAASVNNQIMFGGTINFPGSTPETILTGLFHDTFNDISGPTTIRSDITLEQSLEEDVSGISFKAGFLFVPIEALKFGGTLRFPYTRRADLTLERQGTITTEGSTRPIQENATAETEIDIPFEWSVGASVFLRAGLRVTGSVTYADWEEVQQVTRNSSNPLLIPNSVLPYPSLRTNAFPQNSLLQWRGGLEYIMGQQGDGLSLRAGIFRDGQPYGDADSDRTNLDGYSFGAGYMSAGFGIDVAFTREKGDFVLTSTSGNNESSFTFSRFLISVSWISF